MNVVLHTANGDIAGELVEEPNAETCDLLGAVPEELVAVRLAEDYGEGIAVAYIRKIDILSFTVFE